MTTLSYQVINEFGLVSLQEQYSFFSDAQDGEDVVMDVDPSVLDEWINMLRGDCIGGSERQEIMATYLGSLNETWRLLCRPQSTDQDVYMEHYRKIGELVIAYEIDMSIMSIFEAMKPFFSLTYTPHLTTWSIPHDGPSAPLPMDYYTKYEQTITGILYHYRTETSLQSLPWLLLAEAITISTLR